MAGPDLHVSAWRENAGQGTGGRGKAADLGGGKFRVVFGQQVACLGSWSREVCQAGPMLRELLGFVMSSFSQRSKGVFGLMSAVLASLGVWLPSPQ